jgi:transposase-like protein
MGVKKMKKTTEAERRQLVKECLASGKAKRAWCREKGIAYSTLTNWITKTKKTAPLNTMESVQAVNAVQWAEVTPQPAATQIQRQSPALPTPSQIRLRSGNIEIAVETSFDPELLAGVLRVVSQICC